MKIPSFCFSDHGRIHVILMTSAAFKLDFPDFPVIFGRNCPSKNPIPLKNQIFFQFCHRATCHSFHMTPRCLKNMVPGVSNEPKSKYIFFQKKSPDFLALHMFDRLLQSTYMDLWMVSLAQIGPQASKKLPQGQT